MNQSHIISEEVPLLLKHMVGKHVTLRTLHCPVNKAHRTTCLPPTKNVLQKVVIDVKAF